MVLEAIPGMCLQCYALVTADKISAMAIISLLISASSTGLTATSMFYDFETSPSWRKSIPKWVGVIPNQGRGLAFANVFAMCTLHVLAKASATALLATVSSNYLMYYMLLDYGVYYSYTLIRGDFIYIIPMPVIPSIIFSFIIRFCVKLGCDFSGSPQFKIPFNLGGSYYLFNTISAQISVLVAVHIYNQHPAAEGEPKFTPSLLWKLAIALVTAWAIAFVNFTTRVATPSHRHTFWSTVSGRRFVQDAFLTGKTDRERTSVFSCNRLKWEKDIGKEVKEFTHANWSRWVEEEPGWFADRKEQVPDDYIPSEHLKKMGGANRVRRGSAVQSVRESFRMIEEDAVDTTSAAVGALVEEELEEGMEENV
jgi:hypothetical protein